MINVNFKTKLSWHEVAIRAAFVLITVTCIVWFMPRDKREEFKFEINKVWNHPDLTARANFNVFKSQATIEAEQREVLKLYKPYYIYNEKTGKERISAFRKSYGLMAYALQFNYLRTLTAVMDSIYRQGIIDTRDPLANNIDTLRRVQADHATPIPVKNVVTPREAYERVVNHPQMSGYREVLAKMNLNEYLVPNLTYDSRYSDSVRNYLLKGVATSSGTVQAGEIIIRRGERIDETAFQKLTSYKRAMDRQHVAEHSPMNLIGEAIYVLLFIMGFTIFLGYYRKDYFDNIRSACMIYVVLTIFTILASLLVSHSMLHVYILPFAIVPVFIRVFMDSRTALMAHITVVMICACFMHFPLEFISVELAMGFTAIVMLHELSSRSQFLWTALVTTLIGMLIRLSVFLIRNQDMTYFDPWDYYYLLICGVLIFCSYPLIYLIEKTFGFVSEITLIELSDTNKELLRTMSEVAPGTFQHSIQVGNLAAEIARKLGANAQLVRTGALYHDIGKTQNPIYYTENQSGGLNPHDQLSYIESAQMIISHVTEGIRLANKYHLPTQIRDLIATHHGLGKAKYFYIKYKNEHPDEQVDELLFTYPGPNPFTMEQAILMMADGVEAASRSLPDYTEQSIRSLVDRIIDGMVDEGFFRECPITFRDIAYAKTVLIEKLKTIYHTRISYPEEKK